MLPKAGKVLPNGAQPDHKLMNPYAVAIREALRHKAIKTVMRWTGASERTAKNWLAGTVGPSGEHLILLAQNSDRVLLTFLQLAGRRDNLAAKKLVDARNAIAEALEVLIGLTV
jgi:hypothetical protein